MGERIQAEADLLGGLLRLCSALCVGMAVMGLRSSARLV